MTPPTDSTEGDADGPLLVKSLVFPDDDTTKSPSATNSSQIIRTGSACQGSNPVSLVAITVSTTPRILYETPIIFKPFHCSDKFHFYIVRMYRIVLFPASRDWPLALHPYNIRRKAAPTQRLRQHTTTHGALYSKAPNLNALTRVVQGVLMF